MNEGWHLHVEQGTSGAVLGLLFIVVVSPSGEKLRLPIKEDNFFTQMLRLALPIPRPDHEPAPPQPGPVKLPPTKP